MLDALLMARTVDDSTGIFQLWDLNLDPLSS